MREMRARDVCGETSLTNGPSGKPFLQVALIFGQEKGRLSSRPTVARRPAGRDTQAKLRIRLGLISRVWFGAASWCVRSSSLVFARPEHKRTSTVFQMSEMRQPQPVEFWVGPRVQTLNTHLHLELFQLRGFDELVWPPARPENKAKRILSSAIEH